MDNENINELDEEIEELEEDDVTDNEEQSEKETEASEEVDFEYDEDGNVIISDDSEEIEEPETSEKSNKTDSEESTPSDTEKASDDKDAEIESLRRQLAERDAQIKETLKSLGADENEGIAGLEKLAAEASDKTVEEYRKEISEKREQEEAIKLMQKLKFEEKTRRDLESVQKTFPEAKAYKSVYDIPNFKEFAKFRDMGLTPEQAYSAANYGAVIEKSSEAASQQTRNLSETKSHLRSNVPIGSKDTSITMSKKELAEYKELFPEKSDKEIVALYKQTIKK